MLCPKCGKESNNLRVCAFCQTPYPTDAPARSGTPRSTTAIQGGRQSSSIAAGDPRIAMRRAQTKRWVFIGVLAAFTVGYYFITRDRVIPVGVPMPNLIAGPMSQINAEGLLKSVNATAQIEERAGELTVHVPAALFPERRDGQLAWAQQYARADEVVEGKRRIINFSDPGGIRFARSDEKGVVMTR